MLLSHFKSMEIVFPEQNEDEFVEIAIRLGHKEICFAYPENKLPKELPKTSKLTIKTAIINPAKPAKTRQKCDLIIADKNARAAFEKQDYDIVFGLEKSKENDFMKQRNSGLNQVLCKIAASKDKVYGINFNDVLNSKNRPLVIGRMMQNIMLCKKYKVKMIIFSGAKEPYEIRAQKDLDSFFEIIK